MSTIFSAYLFAALELADYFSSSNDKAESFYGFLEQEINPRYLANFHNEDIAIETDINLGEILGAS